MKKASAVHQDEDDAPCGKCGQIVNSDSRALQCDICDHWLHTECAGVSVEAYKLHGKLEGFPWFCKTCVTSLGEMGKQVRKLRDDNLVLRTEISQLREDYGGNMRI